VAGHLEIDDIALSVRVRSAGYSLAIAGRCDECGPEFLRIGFPDTDRSEYPRLATAAWVLWVQAVLSQLPDLDNGARAIGQLYESSIVTRGGKIETRSTRRSGNQTGKIVTMREWASNRAGKMV
jgi:hypothetical protein